MQYNSSMFYLYKTTFFYLIIHSETESISLFSWKIAVRKKETEINENMCDKDCGISGNKFLEGAKTH